METGRTDKRSFENTVIILVAFIGSIIARLVAISNNPSFLIGGDNPAYVAFSKEIISNGFLVPVFNSIHYPNSLWVVPPLLPELFALITAAVGPNSWNPFYALGVFGIVADSMIVFPLWKITKLLFNRTSAIVAVFAFIFYMPDMDVLTWGGYPQIVGNFLILWIMYYVALMVRNRKPKIDQMLITGILLSFLAVSHDLSSLFILAALVFYLVIRNLATFVQKIGPSNMWEAFRRKTRYVIGSILLSAPAFAYWYIPRSGWVYDSIFHNASVAKLTTISASVLKSAVSNSSALPGQSAQFIIGILAVPVFFAGIIAIIRSRKADEGVFLLLSIIMFSMVTTAITINNGAISGRLIYFSFLPAFIIISYGIATAGNRISGLLKARRPERAGKIVTAVVLAIIISATASIAVPSALSSHSYYVSSSNSSYTGSYLDSAQWVQQNEASGTVIAAPGVYGSFVMGYSGDPVLVYRNPVYLTQPAEWNESVAAYTLIYAPSVNVTVTQQYISQYNVSLVCMYNSLAHNLPSFYKEVYSNNAVSIYSVKG